MPSPRAKIWFPLIATLIAVMGTPVVLHLLSAPKWARLLAIAIMFPAIFTIILIGMTRDGTLAAAAEIETDRSPPKRMPGPGYMRFGRSLRGTGAALMGFGLMGALFVMHIGLLSFVGCIMALIGHALVMRYEPRGEIRMPSGITFADQRSSTTES